MISYFEFADYVRFQGRFVFEGQVQEFLHHIAGEAQNRLAPVSADSILYRAQINRLEDCRVIWEDADPVYVTLPADRMMPDPQLVGDSRLSPRGIAYLYAADSPKTAIAEMRPYKSAAVTVATLKVRDDIRVVDFLAESEPHSVWRDLQFATSFPALSDDSWRMYLPTQCIAEFLRLRGFAGVKYRSSMNDSGYNIALFATECAQITDRDLYWVEQVDYRVRSDDDPTRKV